MLTAYGCGWASGDVDEDVLEDFVASCIHCSSSVLLAASSSASCRRVVAALALVQKIWVVE